MLIKLLLLLTLMPAHASSGYATYYALHGQRTASGERFNMYALTAAHRTYPFGTKVRVTNLNNNKSVVVRITDRPGRTYAVIDLSKEAFRQISPISKGKIPVKIDKL